MKFQIVAFLFILITHPAYSAGVQRQFILKGSICTFESKIVYLKYQNINGIYTTDSSKPLNGIFTFTGEISEPKLAQIIIPNVLSTEIYIEPAKMELQICDSIDGASFVLKGSLTNSFSDECAIKVKRAMLSEGEEWTTREKVETAFMRGKPNTFYAAILLKFYFDDLMYADVKKIYDQMGPAIKLTPTGAYIKDKLTIASKMGNYLKNQNNIFYSPDSSKGSVKKIISSYKYTLIDFWASWCIPCRNASEFLLSVYDKYNSSNFTILAISGDKSSEAWKEAIVKDSTSRFNHFLDSSNSFQNKNGIFGFPAYLLVDDKGKILNKYSGKWMGKIRLEADLNKLMKAANGSL